MNNNRNTRMNHIVLSIDLDEWYQTRWATGSGVAIWKDVDEFFRDYYGTDHPIGEIIPQTKKVLELLQNLNIKTTFFVLGETAQFYPALVKEIHQCGHEIACHGMRHIELTYFESEDEFKQELLRAKQILEDLIGESVIGYRAPSFLIEPWVVQILEDCGFKYDSSINPCWSFGEKYKGMLHASQNPYFLSYDNLQYPGTSNVLEIPVPSFPVLKFPGATGIMTRIAGKFWAKTAILHALKSGDASYYFHPYELTKKPKLDHPPLPVHVYWRRVGSWFEGALFDILPGIGAEIIRARDILKKYER